MKKILLSVAVLLVTQVALFAQGVQATLTTGATPSQVLIRLKNASGAAVSGPLSSFTIAVRIPNQGANNPKLTATAQSGTTAGGQISNINPSVINGGFAYYLVAANYSNQTFPMAINEEKNIFSLSFYGTSGTAAIIPSVEMVTFSTGGPNGPADQLQYYIAIGGDRTDYTNSFYAGTGSTGLNNASDPKVVGIGAVPLSVSWASFTAEKAGSNAILNWATASEKGNTGFEVERSADGKNFSKIGFVSTQANEGNSSEKLVYNFTDSKPLSGVNHYRLKQIDVDGKSTLSEVKQVSFNTATAAVEVYPNPVNGASVRVKGNNISNIVVFNISGQQVKVPVNYGAAENELSISGLSSGNYMLRVTSADHAQTFKLVVQH